MRPLWIALALAVSSAARAEVSASEATWRVGDRAVVAFSGVAFLTKDGHALINIRDHAGATCTSGPRLPPPNEARVTLIMVVRWKTGARLDAEALRPPRRVELSEMRITSGGWPSTRSVWDSLSGNVVTERAPRRTGERGRLRLALYNHGLSTWSFEGVLDVTVCPTLQP